MQSPTAPITLESLFSKLQEIEALVTPRQTATIGATIGDLLTPTEACQALKISRSQFERMKRNGFLKIHRLDPKGRKIYVSLAEISQSFPKDFATQPPNR